MPSTFGSFRATEDGKAVQDDVEDPVKTVQIGAGLSLK
jgi:hypothetical protein